jgi:hypothetical protein
MPIILCSSRFKSCQEIKSNFKAFSLRVANVTVGSGLFAAAYLSISPASWQIKFSSAGVAMLLSRLTDRQDSVKLCGIGDL